MKITWITAITLFLGVLFMVLPSTAKAIELVANEPATIYYTTNGEEPTTTINTDSMMTTLPVSGESTSSTSVFDGLYTLSSTNLIWDGTDADRLKMPTANYASAYGDEASVTYALPWAFTYYGQAYNQIKADTNGNIWFGYSTPTNSFNLARAGLGPVIAAWNNDLSSNLTGGVFIQHKSNPERVVVEWQTETYTDEGRRRLHNFEVVLFQTADIRLDYNSFPQSTTNKDFGSGISSDDGIHYLSISDNFAPVYNLSGSSFTFTYANPIIRTLTISGGSYAFNPPPLGSGYHFMKYLSGTQVRLYAAISPYEIFTGWTNSQCSGTGPCLLTLNSDTSVTMVYVYDFAHKVQVNGNYFSTIQAAYNATANASVIKLWAQQYIESLNFNRPITVTLKGGYDDKYIEIWGYAWLIGGLTITNGTVIADGILIR